MFLLLIIQFEGGHNNLGLVPKLSDPCEETDLPSEGDSGVKRPLSRLCGDSQPAVGCRQTDTWLRRKHTALTVIPSSPRAERR